MGDRETTGQKLSLLRGAALFASLDEIELALVAEHSGYCSFEPNQRIFEEGPHREELFVIKNGAVIVRRTDDNGGERDLARFVEGESFAEMDLLDSSPRTAHAIAEGAATLLVFPDRDLVFREVLEDHPEAGSRLLRKLLGVVARRIRATDKLLSEKSPWIQDLKRQLLRDKLTGLHNRAYVDEELPKVLAAHSSSSLLILKPDNFKPINDTYGHQAGDGALVALAESLRSHLTEGETGVRYHGDEYCIILAGSDAARAARRAHDLLQVVKDLDVTKLTKGQPFALTASIGTAVFPENAASAAAMVERGYRAMMKARNAGGDRVCTEDA